MRAADLCLTRGLPALTVPPFSLIFRYRVVNGPRLMGLLRAPPRIAARRSVAHLDPSTNPSRCQSWLVIFPLVVCAWCKCAVVDVPFCLTMPLVGHACGFLTSGSSASYVTPLAAFFPSCGIHVDACYVPDTLDTLSFCRASTSFFFFFPPLFLSLGFNTVQADHTRPFRFFSGDAFFFPFCAQLHLIIFSYPSEFIRLC